MREDVGDEEEDEDDEEKKKTEAFLSLLRPSVGRLMKENIKKGNIKSSV